MSRADGGCTVIGRRRWSLGDGVYPETQNSTLEVDNCHHNRHCSMKGLGGQAVASLSSEGTQQDFAFFHKGRKEKQYSSDQTPWWSTAREYDHMLGMRRLDSVSKGLAGSTHALDLIESSQSRSGAFSFLNRQGETRHPVLQRAC